MRRFLAKLLTTLLLLAFIVTPSYAQGILFNVQNSVERVNLSLALKGQPNEVALSDVFSLNKQVPNVRLAASVPFAEWQLNYSYETAKTLSGQGTIANGFSFSGKAFGPITATGSTTGKTADKTVPVPVAVNLGLSSHRFDVDLPPSWFKAFGVRPSLTYLLTDSRLNFQANGDKFISATEQKTRSILGAGATIVLLPPAPRIYARFTYFFDDPATYSVDVWTNLVSSVFWNRATSVIIGYRAEKMNYGLGSGDIRLTAQGPYVGVKVLF